ncbi:MAG TPA: sulfite exporter TauE/SafE family protein [Thermoanaerobaculia bacterium]|nr:sulfite exporter TauE/SafE family protein [Thermoanaerobaculia bacterium]
MNAGQIAALLASSAGAGVMNAMAGGGTILTYPTLLFLGESAITANATSTVALWPGALSSMYGYRREVAEHREWLKTLFLPSLLGGALGAVLLLRTPARSFQRLAPFLILFATVLFMLQGAVARWARSGERHPTRKQAPGRWAAAWLYQFGVGVYGGYFGAGIGILMLAVLGFLGLSDIHAANGIKNFFGMCINGLAAGYFIIRGAVDWPAALIMIGGAIIGGYGGAGFARRIGREKARAAVIVIGLLVAGILLFQSR